MRNKTEIYECDVGLASKRKERNENKEVENCDIKEILTPVVFDHDPKNIVYIIFFWLGIGSLLPWNIFISVSDYWMYKFRTVFNSSRVAGDPVIDKKIPDVTEIGSQDGLNSLQVQWFSYLAVASMVPNVIFLILCAVFGRRFRSQLRLFTSLIVMIVCFMFTTVMGLVDSDGWQITFFYLTLFSVVIINTFCAIFQSGLLGIAAIFPPKYIGGVFTGQALGGIFASTTNVILILIGSSPVQSGFSCFLISVFFLFTALISYFLVTLSSFFRFHMDQTLNKCSSNFITRDDDSSATRILYRIKTYALTIFLVFFATLSCYPAITVLISSTIKETSKKDGVVGTAAFEWATKYFTPIGCFFLFNVGDFCGRYLGEKIQMPSASHAHSSSMLLVASLVRLLFIPMFVLCNANPHQRYVTSVWFDSDTTYFILMILFSTSNGYVSSLCMINAPQSFTCSSEQQTAASIMVAFLGIGLGAGALFSNLLVRML